MHGYLQDRVWGASPVKRLWGHTDGGGKGIGDEWGKIAEKAGSWRYCCFPLLRMESPAWHAEVKRNKVLLGPGGRWEQEMQGTHSRSPHWFMDKVQFFNIICKSRAFYLLLTQKEGQWGNGIPSRKEPRHSCVQLIISCCWRAQTLSCPFTHVSSSSEPERHKTDWGIISPISSDLFTPLFLSLRAGPV